jgi:type IV pilus assembly protein PilO
LRLYGELSSIDINDIGSWPKYVKCGVTGLCALCLIGSGHFYIIKPQQAAIEVAKQQEKVLKARYLEKQALAINIDAYTVQMAAAQETFGVLVKQLPNESEIPDLLIDMTQVGLSRGLQFEQIKPRQAVAKDFYAEKLVDIKVNGEYHQIAQFISDLASLPRIINVDNFQLTRHSSAASLSLQAVTKTYYYLDEGRVEGLANAK